MGSITVYFGNYTTGQGAGIYRAELNEETGQLGTPVLAGPAQSPSFVAVHPMMDRLYAVSEQSQGMVTAFAIEADGALRPLNAQSTQGSGPCYVWVDPSGGAVLIANYGSGSSASYPLLQDGSLGPAATFFPHAGSSVDPERQRGPHAHCAITDPTGHRAFVADLGVDKILIFHLDSGSGALTPNDPAYVATPAGGGPRHVAFHPRGRFAYANLEMTSEICVLAHDPESGALRVLETHSTLPTDFQGHNSTAETLVHPGGQFVYVSNRGHNSIAGFRIDQITGKLTPLGRQSTQGEVPRGFGISPDGRHLIAANQKSGNVVVFRIDPATGELSPTGSVVTVPSPVCVRFHRR
jgi:6-phosphogluconolactonase